MKELLNAGQVLGRSEMKKIMAGSGGSCYLTCSNCQNDSCRGYVDNFIKGTNYINVDQN